jgi:hypothetical protein
VALPQRECSRRNASPYALYPNLKTAKPMAITQRLILAALSAYESGRTGVTFAGQTIMITPGLPVAGEAPTSCSVYVDGLTATP